MSNQSFSNFFERRAFPTQSAFVTTSPAGDFTVVGNELVIETVDETALNTMILSIDGAGLVSWKDEMNLNPFDQNQEP